MVIIDAPDDGTMFLKAERLLAGSNFVTMEIGQEKRFVGRVTVEHLRS